MARQCSLCEIANPVKIQRESPPIEPEWRERVQ